jgi:hypothetical protein
VIGGSGHLYSFSKEAMRDKNSDLDAAIAFVLKQMEEEATRSSGESLSDLERYRLTGAPRQMRIASALTFGGFDDLKSRPAQYSEPGQ